ncbi:MAG: LamG domain-containing protein, partial [Bacteroidaceae bacterium]|nr:LamG domain-containing protein [Bacteroidaceae bacterium]
GRIVLYTRVENAGNGSPVRYFYNNFLGGKQNPANVGSFQRGTWQHVAVVCNPVDRTVTYYVNGVRDCTVPANAFEACTGGFRIGGHKANKDYWKGRIDELYFFRGLLSADEIRAVRDNTYFSPTGVKKVWEGDVCPADLQVYNLSGMRLDTLQKGVNVVAGQKVMK